MSDTRPFWQRKALDEMNREEWESLCDGCAKCCLHKLEDEDSGELLYTRVACRYLDQDSCRCTVYAERKRLVPACIELRPGNFESLRWMPNTCAYRLLAEGRPLPLWHPLVSGDAETVRVAGHSVSGRVVSEDFVHEDGFEEHVVDWLSAGSGEEST